MDIEREREKEKTITERQRVAHLESRQTIQFERICLELLAQQVAPLLSLTPVSVPSLGPPSYRLAKREGHILLPSNVGWLSAHCIR